MSAPVQQFQPDITLVQELRMDADMLNDGFQKNLTELWHSDVVREAAKNALRAADRIEELTKALEYVVGFDKGNLLRATLECRNIALEALAPSLEKRS